MIWPPRVSQARYDQLMKTVYYSQDRRPRFHRESVQLVDTLAGSGREWSLLCADKRRKITARMQGGKCFLCGFRLPRRYPAQMPDNEPARPTDEHVVPKCAGGRGPWNLLLAHRKCNNLKGNRHPYPCELLLLASVNFELRMELVR